MFKTRKRTILTGVAAGLVVLLAAAAAFLYFSGLGALLWFIINLEGERPQPELAQRLAESGLVVHTVGGSRPATLALPAGYDRQTPCPSSWLSTATRGTPQCWTISSGFPAT